MEQESKNKNKTLYDTPRGISQTIHDKKEKNKATGVAGRKNQGMISRIQARAATPSPYKPEQLQGTIESGITSVGPPVFIIQTRRGR